MESMEMGSEKPSAMIQDTDPKGELPNRPGKTRGLRGACLILAGASALHKGQGRRAARELVPGNRFSRMPSTPSREDTHSTIAEWSRRGRLPTRTTT